MRKQFSRVIHLEQVSVRSPTGVSLSLSPLSSLPWIKFAFEVEVLRVLLRFSSHLSRVVSFAYATWPGVIRKNEEGEAAL